MIEYRQPAAGKTRGLRITLARIPRQIGGSLQGATNDGRDGVRHEPASAVSPQQGPKTIRARAQVASEAMFRSFRITDYSGKVPEFTTATRRHPQIDPLAASAFLPHRRPEIGQLPKSARR